MAVAIINKASPMTERPVYILMAVLCGYGTVYRGVYSMGELRTLRH